MSRLFEFDRSFRNDGQIRIAGMDEAGRGPLAGPVVAAAVILPGDFFVSGLRDSKKIPAARRRELVFDILTDCEAVGVAVVDAERIDVVNILEATKEAMRTAVTDLDAKPDLLLVDGLFVERIPFPQKKLIRGDDTSATVAAASIVAKEIRDGIMRGYHEQFPHYGFDRHKGYGTRLHLERLARHGPCAIHRRSFGPVRSLPLPF